MAHTYIVTKATYVPGSAPDPTVTIVGTVDGTPVTVQIWRSAIQQANTAGGIAAIKSLVSPIMLNQATINNPPAPISPVSLPTGSWAQ